MRIAVVDIGTNSTRLLVAEASDGEVRPVKTGLITTRLGEGIGTCPVLGRQAMERTVEALHTFKRTIAEMGAERVIVAATSAVRDAVNRGEFLQEVKEKVGWDVQVLSGPDEARMSYLGVIRGLEVHIPNPVVTDIGGGSTEFMWGGPGDLQCTSVKAGAVRMTEQGSSLQEIKELLKEVLQQVRNSGAVNLIGVGGTVTTLAAIDQELEIYNPDRVHGYFLSRDRVKTILERLEKMTPEEKGRLPGLQPQRADIIVAGTRIALAVIEGMGADGITVSETDLLYGLLYDSLRQK